ncbi:Asp-tRNA(Asn)/Glu-tRNA(Gln) amidotransferase subunit GatC [Candidatus Avelusimicrobium sp.]|uniref:Asp-tRNA(Asn)/Glu-tRNA(Gln) amidotransferase subunit GatC n=1 Tax=Candidatus Avelusimicrobium sp. TaxID=3048833 RepID=UPI003D7E7F6B
MEITKKDVALAAKLAKMQVSEQEAAIYQEQLEALFKWVKELSAVNTDSVKLTNANHSAHIRRDEPVSDLDRAAALRREFGALEDDCAKVKKVL